MKRSYKTKSAFLKNKEVTDGAIQQSYDNAHEDWYAVMMRMVNRVARTHATFTTDEVFVEFAKLNSDLKTHDNRAMGALMRMAAGAGWCEPTNTTKCTTRRSNHMRPLRVWNSLLYRLPKKVNIKWIR